MTAVLGGMEYLELLGTAPYVDILVCSGLFSNWTKQRILYLLPETHIPFTSDYFECLGAEKALNLTMGRYEWPPEKPIGFLHICDPHRSNLCNYDAKKVWI